VTRRSRGPFAAIAIAAALAVATPARAITVVTVGKSAVLRQAKGGASALFRIGRDPAFATLVDPTCAGGGSMTLQVASYPVATARVDALAEGDAAVRRLERARRRLTCTAIRPARPAASRRSCTRARASWRASAGTAYRHVPGPVGYAELWIEIADARLNVRLHNFRTNAATVSSRRKPSPRPPRARPRSGACCTATIIRRTQQDTALRSSRRP
jgi:hypothetical protein